MSTLLTGKIGHQRANGPDFTPFEGVEGQGGAPALSGQKAANAGKGAASGLLPCSPIASQSDSIGDMSELRDYQQDLLERVHRLLDAPDARVMLQLPTGGGKTRIAGDLLSRWLKDRRKAVWLTHRKELAAQTEGMLQQDGVTATSNMRWEPHTNAPTLVNGVVILMAQTVGLRTATANVWGGYNSNDLMVIDEAHHATAESWARAMRQWPGPHTGHDGHAVAPLPARGF